MTHPIPAPIEGSSNKVDPAFKEKWVAALRSGKYSQAMGRLRADSGFCCLGVAEDLALEETGNEWQPTLHVDEDDGKPFNTFVLKTRGYEGTTTSANSAATCRLQKLANVTPLGAIPILLIKVIQEFVIQRLTEMEGVDEVIAKVKSINGLPYTPRTLANYNDHGVPFSVIADVIEKFF